MKKNISQTLLKAFKLKGILAVSGALIMASCGSQVNAYSETDGVYYDPNKDTMPEVIVDRQGNQVDQYYDYQDSTYVDTRDYSRKYRGWKERATSSDWGTYAGSETYYSGWSDPFYNGFYSPFGWGNGFGMSFGWGSPWYGYGYNPFSYFGSYYGYYSPFYSGYYGYPMSYYSPYYYSPYGGYYSPYSYYCYGYPVRYQAPRRPSGADSMRVTQGTRSGNYTGGNNGFRTPSPQTARSMQYPNSSYRTRSEAVRRMPSTEQPRYRTNSENVYRNDVYRSQSNDSFRSGGFRIGSDGGGFRSGGYDGGSRSSGGGFRTGGSR